MSAQPPHHACVAAHARRRGTQAWRAAIASMVAILVSQPAAAPVWAEPGPRRARVQAEPGPRRARVRIELMRGPGTERCPDEQFLRAEIARHMGFDPFDAEAPLTMTSSIEQEQGELIASTYLRDRRGRVLWADGHRSRGDCTTLVSAMALSIAVQLDDAGTRPPPQGTPAAPAEPAAPEDVPCAPERPCAGQAAPPPSTAPPVHPPGKAPPVHPPGKAPRARQMSSVRAPPPSGAGQAAAERFRWTVGAGATMALGLTPGVAVGPTLSVAGRWPAWSVALEARGLSSLSTNVDEVRVATSAFTTGAALCLHRHFLVACGVGELGVLRAVPEVPWNAAVSRHVRAGIGARAGVTWPFSESLSGYGYTEAVQRLVDSSLLRHEGMIESERTVWGAPAIGLAFGMGLQLKL